jgi:hypothetical protein
LGKPEYTDFTHTSKIVTTLGPNELKSAPTKLYGRVRNKIMTEGGASELYADGTTMV